MKAKNIVIVSSGMLLTVGGLVAGFLDSVRLSITALLLLGLLIVLLLVLQRRQQARIQERILYLVKSERSQNKAAAEQNTIKSLASSNAIFAKKITGLLHAQQISMERLQESYRRELKTQAFNSHLAIEELKASIFAERDLDE